MYHKGETIMRDVEVSVFCCTYNHKNFIEKAIKSFLMQKTDFDFEIIIYDDASTDGTTDIVKKYAEKYPGIIVPIIPEENQYSKGIKIAEKYFKPIAKGKYIALCEGDDYWIDENKLQQQYDYMKTNPQCSMCVHEAVQINYDTNEQRNVTDITKDRDFKVDEVILGGGELFSTNSFFMKKNIYFDRLPCFAAKGFYDYQLCIYGAINGYIHYFSKPMSVYNYAVPGSWSVRVSNVRDKKISHNKELIRMLNEVNKYYNYKFDRAINKKIDKTQYGIYRLNGDYLKLLNRKYKQYYEEDAKRGKLLILKECFAIKYKKVYEIYKRIF